MDKLHRPKRRYDPEDNSGFDAALTMSTLLRPLGATACYPNPIAMGHIARLLIGGQLFREAPVGEALLSLSEVDPRKARVVKTRYFAGLSVEETAEALQISPETAKSGWKIAKAWLLS
jgi:DNA-directed RNA polymerase specialized sigma24 family protein